METYTARDGKTFNTKGALIAHEAGNGLEKDDVIADLYFGGIRPACKCNCGKKAKYNRATRKFNDYLQGHIFNVIDNPSTGTKGTQKARDKMRSAQDTRKKGFAAGTMQQNWNKGKTAETNESIKKVADSQRDVPRSDEDRERISIGRKKFIKRLKESGEYGSYNEHMRVYWADPVHREEQSLRSAKNIEKMAWKRSKFEIDVENFLNKNNVINKNSFRISVNGYNKVYDFLIDDKILLECDGDFLHCNPTKFLDGPVYDRQHHHVANDKIKNELAKEMGYELIRIWHSEFYKDSTILLDRINALQQ